MSNADHSSQCFEATGARKHSASDVQQRNENGDRPAYSLSPLHARSFIRTSGIEARGNASVRAAALQTMQHTHGNRAVQRYVQRATAPGQQRVQVQRWDPSDMWDYASKVGSDLMGAGQDNGPSTPEEAPVGPVIMPDNIGWPVGPTIEDDNLAVPEYQPWV